MGDRELLELAAKAANWNWSYYDEIDGLVAEINPDEGVGWNPLVNDGDALRLAVKLGLHIVMYTSGKVPCHEVTAVQVNQINIGVNDNPCAATRRAIVRAAAEIGMAMA